jgi:hypothetical protein
MISILIDDVTAQSNEYYPLITKAVENFIQNGLSRSDQVAILSASGGANFPYSDDKQILLQEVRTLFKKLSLSRPQLSDCPEMTSLEAQSIAQGHSRFHEENLSATAAMRFVNLAPQQLRN